MGSANLEADSIMATSIWGDAEENCNAGKEPQTMDREAAFSER
jgi:hypothetical protein